MARAPVITSPCPLRWASMPQEGRDHCGHCDRKVHNLDGMSDAQRQAFLGGCAGKVCVAYTVHRSRQRRNVALGAGLLAAMAGSAPAFASEEAIGFIPLPTGDGVADAGSGSEPIEYIEEILMGGIEDARNARWADEADLEGSVAAEPEVIGVAEWLPSSPE